MDPLALGVAQGVIPVTVGFTVMVTPLHVTTLVSVNVAVPVQPAELFAVMM
jgi:hypothetical protein